MKDIHINMEPFKCIECDNLMEFLTAAAPDRVPVRSEGDFNVCAHCGAIYIFDADLDLVPATIEELSAAAKAEPEIILQLNFARNYILKIAREKCESYACHTCGNTFKNKLLSGLAEETPPEQGDFLLCSDCITLHRVSPDYELRMCTPEQIEQMRKDLPKFEQVHLRMEELKRQKAEFFTLSKDQIN